MYRRLRGRYSLTLYLLHRLHKGGLLSVQVPLGVRQLRCGGETLPMKMVQEGQVEEEEEEGEDECRRKARPALALSSRSPWLLPLIASYIGLKMTKLDLMAV